MPAITRVYKVRQVGRAIVVAVPTRLCARLKLKPGAEVDIRLASADDQEVMVVRRVVTDRGKSKGTRKSRSKSVTPLAAPAAE